MASARHALALLGILLLGASLPATGETVTLTYTISLGESFGSLPAGTPITADLVIDLDQEGAAIDITNVRRFEIETFTLTAGSESVLIGEVVGEMSRWLVVGNNSPANSNENFLSIFVEAHGESAPTFAGEVLNWLSVVWSDLDGVALAGYALPQSTSNFEPFDQTFVNLNNKAGSVTNVAVTPGESNANAVSVAVPWRGLWLLAILLPVLAHVVPNQPFELTPPRYALRRSSRARYTAPECCFP